MAALFPLRYLLFGSGKRAVLHLWDFHLLHLSIFVTLTNEHCTAWTTPLIFSLIVCFLEHILNLVF